MHCLSFLFSKMEQTSKRLVSSICQLFWTLTGFSLLDTNDDTILAHRWINYSRINLHQFAVDKSEVMIVSGTESTKRTIKWYKNRFPFAHVWCISLKFVLFVEIKFCLLFIVDRLQKFIARRNKEKQHDRRLSPNVDEAKALQKSRKDNLVTDCCRVFGQKSSQADCWAFPFDLYR